MINLGKVKPGSTLYIPFESFNSSGASVTLTGLAVTDIEIYKNGSVTQRASDTGYTLLDTDGIDFDGVTGIHGFSLDLSSNATADFFTAGGFYWVVVSAVTIDSQTVTFIAATFSIGYEGALLDTTIATLSTQTSFTLTVGPAEDDALNGCVVVIHDIASAVQFGKAVILDYTGSTKTVTLVAGVTFTAAAGDNISVMPPALQPSAWGGVEVVQTGDSFARIGATGSGLTTLATQASVNTIDDFLDTEVAAIVTTLGTPAGASISADILTLDNLVDDLESRIGTPSNLGGGATVAANLADIEAQTDDIGAAGAGLTALATQASVDTIDNFLDTEIAAIIAALNGIVLASGAIGATGNDTTHLHLSGLAYGNDGINSMLLSIKDVSTGLYYSRWIEDFVDASDLATVATLPFTPEASVDQYWIIPVRADVTGGSGLDAAGVRAAIGLASANLDTQLSTIDDFLDTEVAAIKAKTDNLPSDPADASDIASSFTTVNTKLDTIDDFLDTEIAAIKAKTDNLPTDPADESNVLAAIAALNNLSAAQVNAEVDTALADVRLDELLAADSDIDGAAPPTVGSVFHELMTKTAGSFTYDQTTDALEALRDNLATASALATAQTSIDDIPTNAELATSQAAADDATLAAIAALNNLSQANIRTAVGLASANLDTQLDALPTNAELATSQAAADDATLAAIAALNNLSAAQVNAEVVDALAVDVLADSVATDGSRPTIAQAVLMMLRFLTEKSVSGTTVTVKKEDGSTTSMTFTLDSGTAPTSITRAS